MSLNVIIPKKNAADVFINSADRESGGTSVNFDLQLPNCLLNNVAGLVIEEVNIPNMLNNVETELGFSSQFIFEMDDTTVHGPFTFDTGFYTVTEIAQRIVDDFNLIGNPEVMSFQYNSPQGKIIFSMTGPRAFRFNSTAQPLDLVRDRLKIGVDGPYTNLFKGINKVDLFTRIKTVFVEIDITNSNYVSSLGGEKSFVASVPVITQHGSWLRFKHSGDLEKDIDFPIKQNLSRLRVRLVGDDNEEVTDLLGFNWNMTMIALL